MDSRPVSAQMGPRCQALAHLALGLELRRDGSEVHLAPWLLGAKGSASHNHPGDGDDDGDGNDDGEASSGPVLSAVWWLAGLLGFCFYLVLWVFPISALALSLAVAACLSAWSYRRHGALETPTLLADARELRGLLSDTYRSRVQPWVLPVAERLGGVTSLIQLGLGFVSDALLGIPAVRSAAERAAEAGQGAYAWARGWAHAVLPSVLPSAWYETVSVATVEVPSAEALEAAEEAVLADEDADEAGDAAAVAEEEDQEVVEVEEEVA